ncbi:hypothetical protein TSAR_012844 [Trichomalopsis sarcophagae]|uniref:Uncharacterized protein n=1 Tax=Trichomalopsis sarcophagae TaxID=543379 RepID=A0A232ETD2_9HYME|nr:hypothetical protein TSAR_012844 [Trichomalopsis sarcophagae]
MAAGEATLHLPRTARSVPKPSERQRSNLPEPAGARGGRDAVKRQIESVSRQETTDGTFSVKP